MDQEFECSILKSGFLLMMLLFFYAVFFTGEDYGRQRQQHAVEKETVVLDDAVNQGIQRQSSVEEAVKEVVRKQNFVDETIQCKIENNGIALFLRDAVASAVIQRSGAIRGITAMRSTLMRRNSRSMLRMIVLLLLIWMFAGLWQNNLESFYRRFRAGKTAWKEIYRNLERRGPPVEACFVNEN